MCRFVKSCARPVADANERARCAFERVDLPPQGEVMFERRKVIKSIAASAAVAATALLTGAHAQAPVKAGFIYVSPIGDAGWTFQHDTGRKEMEKALGGKVTSKYIENVPEGADAERVIRELAQTGH